MKALETPEEKRARRLKKKEEKERRRREKMGWDKKDLVSRMIWYIRVAIGSICIQVTFYELK